MKKVWTALLAAALLLFLGNCALAQDAVPQIKADGDLADWAGIYSLCPGEDKVAILYAFTTDDALYVAFQAPDSTNIGVYDVLLNTDGDFSTGYQCDGRHPRAGADFLIETWTGAVYAGATGAEWEWTGGTYDIQKATSADGTTVEIIAPLSVLGSPKTLYIAAWAMNSDWTPFGFAPEIGADMARVPYYTEVLGAPVTEPIVNIALEQPQPLKALEENAMPGGLAGMLSAAGGDGENYIFSFKQDASRGRDNALFTIRNNALLVGDSPLAPGEYKVCVQVQSSVRKESAAFTLEVLEQRADAVVTASLFDGLDRQWFTVRHDALSSPQKVTALKALTDGNKLYFFIEARNLTDDFCVYFGTEAARGADMTVLWSGAYPTHKMTADGKLYAFEKGAWSDTGRTVRLRRTEKGAEGFVVGARLNNLAKCFMLGVTDGEKDILPDCGASMLTVTSPIRSFEPALKANGDPGDWEGIEPLAEGDGVLGPLYAARTDDMLYVMTTISGVTDETDDRAFSLNILLDADGNNANGFAHEAYPAHSGIDLLLQDWHSQNLELFVFQKPSTEWFSCVYRAPEGVKKAVRLLGGDTYCVEYAIPISLLRDQLERMSDDFYIAADREKDMQEGTSAGCAPKAHTAQSGLVRVPKYRTATGALSLNDDTFADWDGIGNQAVASSDASTMNLYATMSDKALYVLLKAPELTLNNVLSIKADERVYEVREGRLSGNGAEESVLLTVCADSAAFRVSLAALGNPEKISVRVSAKDGALILPAEGMMEVSARCELWREPGACYPEETFEQLDNPYQGWMGWASADPDAQTSQKWQTAFLDIKWAEFEPVKGVYDFDSLDEKYHLSAWKERGVRVVLRFVMDDVVDEGGAQRMDIPKWLYDELIAENYAGKGAGTFYYDKENLGGGGFSPNYESPLLLKYHRLAINQLAKRFDDPAITAYVQVGSLGHWAEMHCWPDGTGEFPAPALVGEYMSAYEAFTHVLKAARKPYPYAAEHAWGLYNDMFGDSGASDSFKEYFTNGCTDMPGAASADVTASQMPSFWKYGYSGGEFAEGNVRKFITDERIVETLRLARESHTSLLGPCSPADLLLSAQDAHAYDANLKQLHNLMGCRLSVESVTEVSSAAPGSGLDLSFTWLNRGVAPFYYAWPIELSLKGKDGQVVFAQTLSADIRLLLPGRTAVSERVTLPDDLALGDYTLCVSVLDPNTGAPGFNLALAAQDSDLRCPLYTIEVR